MQFQAICFDLDGTLLDSLADLAHCTNTILSKRGFEKKDLTGNIVGVIISLIIFLIFKQRKKNGFI